MRAVLAAQPATAETRTPGLGHRLRGLLALMPPAPKTTPFALHAAPEPAATEAETLLPAFYDDPAPGDPVPAELLLGDLAPRRPAFGQRTETVLELEHPAPSGPQRLTLMAADGASVGEIILHGQAINPANDASPRRAREPLHSEAPFFPEDLADEPPPVRARGLVKAPAPVQRPASEPEPELPAAFLLATLAARLASEEAALRQRLVTAQSLLRAA